ncbi:hypothetical protein IEO21_04233 [Rhodonia placenta]|uniref:Uncharacterized protein n=1 Tax=Rhodonia placenta TaxID=104341 RepID=A0A8H7U375_9APHY|nr:hypothetical protein IEO21_04233 [Postia placenta]
MSAPHQAVKLPKEASPASELARYLSNNRESFTRRFTGAVHVVFHVPGCHRHVQFATLHPSLAQANCGKPQATEPQHEIVCAVFFLRRYA